MFNNAVVFLNQYKYSVNMLLRVIMNNLCRPIKTAKYYTVFFVFLVQSYHTPSGVVYTVVSSSRRRAFLFHVSNLKRVVSHPPRPNIKSK